LKHWHLDVELLNALESWMYKLNQDCPARLHPPWLANACAKSGQCMSMLSTQLKMTVTVLISDVRLSALQCFPTPSYLYFKQLFLQSAGKLSSFEAPSEPAAEECGLRLLR